jgi:hypothetical protein
MRRIVKRSEVRVNCCWSQESHTHYLEIMTGPQWAFRESDFLRGEPIAAAWAPLLRDLQKETNKLYREDLARYEDFQANIGAEENRFRVFWGVQPRKPERVKVWLPSYFHRAYWNCATCGKEYYCCSLQSRYCTETCFAKRPRPSRAKPRQARRCIVCGEEFTPARKHARTCSGRCRVAYHRAKGRTSRKLGAR